MAINNRTVRAGADAPLYVFGALNLDRQESNQKAGGKTTVGGDAQSVANDFAASAPVIDKKTQEFLDTPIETRVYHVYGQYEVAGATLYEPAEYDSVEIEVETTTMDDAIHEWEKKAVTEYGFIPDEDTRAALVYVTDTHAELAAEDEGTTESPLYDDRIHNVFPVEDEWPESEPGEAYDSTGAMTPRAAELHAAWVRDELLPSEEKWMEMPWMKNEDYGKIVEGFRKLREGGQKVMESLYEDMWDAGDNLIGEYEEARKLPEQDYDW